MVGESGKKRAENRRWGSRKGGKGVAENERESRKKRVWEMYPVFS